MTLQDRLNQLGYCKIEISYGFKDDNNFRVYVYFTERESTFFEFDRNGNIVFERGTMFGDKKLSESEKANIIEIVLSENAPCYRGLYIRFGELPKSGKSKNYATGEYENGISVYDARYDIGEGAFEICGNALSGAAFAGLLSGKNIYLLSGEEYGTGSDGEPTIRNAKIISELNYSNGKYLLK